MTFGERLRATRVNARMSQADLTRLSGVPKTMLSRYENNHILPSISTLQKLAHALGTGEASLLGDGEGAEQRGAQTFVDALGRRGIVLQDDDCDAMANLIADLIDEGNERVRFLSAPRAQRA